MYKLTTAIMTTTALVAAPVFASAQGMPAFCENAFHAADKNADGTLTQEEIAAMRDAEFEQLDVNDDDLINRNEFRKCMAQRRDMAVEQAADSGDETLSWSDLASDGSTSLTREDFAAAVEAAWEGGEDSENTLFKYLAENMDDAIEDDDLEEGFAQAAVSQFQTADTNGDGILTKEEFETPMREKTFSDQGFDARFQEMDADNSGAISPQEYRAAGTWSPNAMGATTSESDSAEVQVEIPVIRYYILTY
jgi:Ca2+-binding EF-hand superfamily protein